MYALACCMLHKIGSSNDFNNIIGTIDNKNTFLCRVPFPPIFPAFHLIKYKSKRDFFISARPAQPAQPATPCS